MQASDVKRKKIDGKDIIVTPFMGFVSLKYQSRLVKMIGPAFGGLANKAKALDNSADSIIDIVGTALNGLAESIDEDKFSEFMLELHSQTRIDGSEVNTETFNNVYAAHLSTMYKVIAFILEVNYSDFLGDGAFGKLLQKSKQKSAVETMQ
jgi:hypothetical protein